MSVGSDGIWPPAHLLPLHLPPLGGGPDGLVVVEEVREVVLDEVFARHTQVHRVPVGELPTELPAQSAQCTKNNPLSCHRYRYINILVQCWTLLASGSEPMWGLN